MSSTKSGNQGTTSAQSYDAAKRSKGSLSIRLDDQDRDRLEKCAEIYRKQTGSQESATGLARTFIQIGLNQFEQRGGLSVNA